MMKRTIAAIAILLLLSLAPLSGADLTLNDKDYFEAQGLSVLLYHNAFHGVFSDQKLSGLEMILHGERIATNGDIRLSPTPEQWDPIPRFKERTRTAAGLSAACTYADQALDYRMEVTPEPGGFRIAVHLDQPLPQALVGKAGFNLEFVPTSYFGKSYAIDGRPGIFPRHPNGSMTREPDGSTQPLPLASGKQIVLSPEDAATRVSIASDSGPVMLFDGRNKAQNGWFVVRTLIPAGQTTNAIVWHVRPNVIPGWTRPPVVGYNQLGYTPGRSKIAVLELDPRHNAPQSAAVLRIEADGQYKEAFRGAIKPWGKWLRYQYAHFDFSSVQTPGTYVIEYDGRRTAPFRIDADVYKNSVWQPSLDTFLPVQMDHMAIREAYRIWHGKSHMDDARQAPTNHTHFDGYSMGASTDSKFKPGEHIPGLNIGGWYDAGDFDIRTQTQAEVVTDLVIAREMFGLDWDQTTVDQSARYVQIRKPDGVNDVLQQIEHGVLGLLAQYRAIGHAIPGIVEPTLEQYTHLGDGASKTDNRIYVATMGKLDDDGLHSGIPDDRWAFTTRTSPLDWQASSALAAASRVLRGYNDKLADECLEIAVRVWAEEQTHPPIVIPSFNTGGGEPTEQETRATVELLIATKGGAQYQQHMRKLLPAIKEKFTFLGPLAVRALPFMDAAFKQEIAAALRESKAKWDADLAKNPWGVPINLGATWGGSGWASDFASRMHIYHKAFPEIIGPEYTFRGFDYVLGRHPASNVSYVSGVGTQSKLVAYGNNRADYTFIPGGIIPGIVVVQPDFPELKDSWPFLWFENEYVVNAATNFILAANAADDIAH